MVDQEDVAQFMAITGCEDTDIINNFLEFGGGDIGTAVQLYMESEGMNTSRNTESASTSTDRQQTQEVRAPIAPKRELLAASNMAYIGSFDAHGQGPRGYSQLGEEWDVGSSRATAAREMIFAPPRDLMFNGSFEMARKEAKEKKLWIMVTLHDESEFPCVEFNRDIWTDKTVKEIVKSNFVFLFYESNSPAGQQHVNYYEFHSYPYVAIMDPITKERVKFWSRKMTPTDFLMEVSEFLSAKESDSAGPKKKKPKSSDITMMTEEQQLELALKASMGGDSVQDLANEISDDDVEILPEKAKDPKTVFEDISPISNYSPTTKDTTRLQIKFPTGKRVVQIFDKNALVSTLFGVIKGTHAEDIVGPFDLINIRQPLLSRLSETLESAQVIGTALTLDYIL